MKELKTILNEKLFVEELNNTLSKDGVIAFVTDTVWGLGCLVNNKKAVDRIYEIKGRDRSKPLILMSNEYENLKPYVKNLSKKANEIIKCYFPGALTLVVEKSEKTPYYITSNKETVGIRIPDNEFFKQLCSVVEGGVLATTSANLSGNPSSKSYIEAKNSIGHLVDYVFEDYGFTSKGLESTVVLVVEDSLKILRQGAVFLD